MRRSLSASLALCALAAAATSCVIVDPDGCRGGGATILVSPSVVFIAVGESKTPNASWCRDGRHDHFNPNWSLGSAADADIISLDPVTGQITGKRAGTATVIATYAGAEGARIQVTVR